VAAVVPVAVEGDAVVKDALVSLGGAHMILILSSGNATGRVPVEGCALRLLLVSPFAAAAGSAARIGFCGEKARDRFRFVTTMMLKRRTAADDSGNPGAIDFETQTDISFRMRLMLEMKLEKKAV